MAPPSKTAEKNYLGRILAGASLFSGASEADIAELCRSARLVAVQRGKEIAPPKGKDVEICVIETGAVAELEGGDPENKSILIALHGPGSAVGLTGASGQLSKNGGAGARELRALTNVTLVAMPAAEFHRIRRRSPEISEACIAALAENFSGLADRMVSALQNPLEQRLAAFFTQIADISTGNRWEPTANIGRMQQTLVADLLGVSREHVNRTLIMWERSGLIFQSKSGDLIIEDRKRLSQLASNRRPAIDASNENEWIAEIEAHLNCGLNEAAHDLAMEGVRRSPRDDRFKYFAALSIARMGALKEALSLVESFKLSTDAANQDIASIGPRLRRDLAFAGGAAPDKTLLRRAAEGFESVFKALRTTYPGLNAASTFAMAGDPERARSLAAEVAGLASVALDDIDEDDPSYWQRATLAECRLIAGDAASALAEFGGAAAATDAAPGKIATTRKQLRRLKSAAGIDDAWIDRAMPQGEVTYFCGPLIPGGVNSTRQLDRLRSRFEDYLDGRNIAAAVGALAAGADIVLAEALVDAGVPLHVHLPLSPTDFLAASVAPAGDEWRDRYIACIERAQSIEWIRRTKPSRAAYRLGSLVAMGRSIRQADDLAARPAGFFAVQRGRDASNSVSHENAEIWRSLGHDAEIAADDWAATTSEAKSSPASVFRAALVVDGRIGDSAALKPTFVIESSSLSVFAFATTEDAIAAARSVLKTATNKARIWLDVGVVDETSDATRAEFPSALITASCRPQSAVGKAFASDAFYYAAAASPGAGARFEYVGISQTEEKLDPCPLFLADL